MYAHRTSEPSQSPRANRSASRWSTSCNDAFTCTRECRASVAGTRRTVSRLTKLRLFFCSTHLHEADRFKAAVSAQSQLQVGLNHFQVQPASTGCKPASAARLSFASEGLQGVNIAARARLLFDHRHASRRERIAARQTIIEVHPWSALYHDFQPASQKLLHDRIHDNKRKQLVYRRGTNAAARESRGTNAAARELRGHQRRDGFI
jgi:hypothetical protein